MVYYFTSRVVDPPALIFMGKDKFENEELIKHGLADDIWWHVDKLSSAHVYLRLPSVFNPKFSTHNERENWWSQIEEELLVDCAQLVKANSIEGNKKDNVPVVYTPTSNLFKTRGMETGQVSFRKDKMVRRTMVKSRENAIINRLMKTRVEKSVDDFKNEVAEIKKQWAAESREVARKRREEDLKLQRERKAMKELTSYDQSFKQTNMTSNAEVASRYIDTATGDVDFNAAEDDFM
eukprot:Partr_v1_DN23821_c0_g1_i1_m64046 putative Coiled-coil domain-containing protein